MQMGNNQSKHLHFEEDEGKTQEYIYNYNNVNKLIERTKQEVRGYTFELGFKRGFNNPHYINYAVDRLRAKLEARKATSCLPS